MEYDVILEKVKNMFFNIIIFLSVIVIIINFFIATPVRVYGISMEPTYYDGEYVIINRLSHDYLVGEVLVLKSLAFDEKHIIKRLIGKEGDLIEILDGKVYVNGIELEEEYVVSDWVCENLNLMVPDDEIFVMGDNRNHSSDSRIFGTVPIDNVVGYVIFDNDK